MTESQPAGLTSSVGGSSCSISSGSSSSSSSSSRSRNISILAFPGQWCSEVHLGAEQAIDLSQDGERGGGRVGRRGSPVFTGVFFGGTLATIKQQKHHKPTKAAIRTTINHNKHQ